MAAAISSTTALMTNSPVASIFASVSFAFQSARRDMPKTTVGGECAIALKNENGARFATPSADTVDTSAIGRGTTTPVKTR